MFLATWRLSAGVLALDRTMQYCHNTMPSIVTSTHYTFSAMLQPLMHSSAPPQCFSPWLHVPPTLHAARLRCLLNYLQVWRVLTGVFPSAVVARGWVQLGAQGRRNVRNTNFRYTPWTQQCSLLHGCIWLQLCRLGDHGVFQDVCKFEEYWLENKIEFSPFKSNWMEPPAQPSRVLPY